jgi:hypothetical protein
MWSFIQKTFKASSSCTQHIIFFSLEILEIDSNDLGFNLNSIEIKSGIQQSLSLSIQFWSSGSILLKSTIS